MSRTNTFITVATFTSPWEAHIAKGRLETEGIPVFIAHEHHVWVDWVYSQALGGVKVQVPTNFAEEAGEIIGAHLRGEYESALPKEFKGESKNICPNCGSESFESRYPLSSIFLVILKLGLFSIIFPVRKKHHSCKNCFHVWIY